MSGGLAFEARCVVVTGGSSGIGAATARMFREHGASVYVLDRAPPADDASPFLEADVTNAREVEQAIGRARAECGRLDALVCCAGITRDGVLWKLTDDDWSAVLAVNLTGAFYCLRAAAGHLRDGGGGSIVLVSSINAERGKFGQTNYAASKAGLTGLAKSAARELGRFKVRVNVVAPGLTESPMTAGLPEAARSAALAESLLGRFARPEDVAGPILFLCSELSRHVTGQVLRVDGGQYL
jgi:NAD(P)-dependent dehydrogenase (short-subunit alcohol dehydrogenase family)